MIFPQMDIQYAYETLKDDPVTEFYVPVLSAAKRYDRIAGFFSSSALALSARGIAGLITNGGRMRLIASPHLSKEDAAVLEASADKPAVIAKLLSSELETFINEAEHDHVQALGWMLEHGYLEIRLATIATSEASGALFHQKVGIFEDLEGNRISFSGSINESASGWLANSEEFKVFKSWEPGQACFFEADEEKFESLWDGSRPQIRVFSLPEAIEDNLIHISADFSIDSFLAKKYTSHRKKKTIADRLSLFPYQREAVKTWVDNGYSLLFEMATGTGKTRTAIACIHEMLERVKKAIVVIATPQSTLSRQWFNEIVALGIPVDTAIIVDGTNPQWRSQLDLGIKQICVGMRNNLFVFTTHTTASSDDFIRIITSYSTKYSVCFVGDEAHGLGARKAKRALLPEYEYRIGLSATPKRWFDDYGTAILEQYFGSATFSFDIGEALTTTNPITNKPFLVNYRYRPVFVALTENEFGEYMRLSTRIKKMAKYSASSDEYQARLEYLLFARANIEKGAKNKLVALERELDGMGEVNQTIIFAADSQIEDVMVLLSRKGIVAHRFTEAEGTKPDIRFGGISERQYIIEKFKRGKYQVLVAIKCLDEGIDIPSAETAFIMASSTNPREYIQRIGRVIRQAPSKGIATIYDFTIEPDMDRIKDPDVAEFELRIFKKEFRRIEDMSLHSINNAEVYVDLCERMRRVQDGCKSQNT